MVILVISQSNINEMTNVNPFSTLLPYFSDWRLSLLPVAITVIPSSLRYAKSPAAVNSIMKAEGFIFSVSIREAILLSVAAPFLSVPFRQALFQQVHIFRSAYAQRHHTLGHWRQGNARPNQTKHPCKLTRISSLLPTIIQEPFLRP